MTERWQAQEEVQRWNIHLEDRVVERTKELVLVNEELEAETVKNKQLGSEVVDAATSSMASITYASSIQRSLIPAAAPVRLRQGHGPAVQAPQRGER